jgi:hypothetical protein
VGFTETQYLPAEAGCYLILNALNAILYVGKATNIRKRHENKSHHRFNDFTLANAARIAFKTCELEDLDKLESSLIEHFKPTLNVAKANSGTNADALIDGKTIEQCLERYVELAPVLKEIQAEIEALKPAVTEYVFSNGGKVEGPGWNLRATSSAKHTNTARRFSCSKKSYKSCKSKRKRMG